MQRGLAVVAASCAAVCVVAGGVAQAAVGSHRTSNVIASFTSADCGNPDAPIWKVAYKLYWRSKNGMTADRSQLDTILQETNTFVQDVGTFSECGVRMHLDVIDAGSAAFDGQDGPPSGHEGLLKQGYDSALYRYPGSTDKYYGLSGGGAGDRWSIFPIPPNDDVYDSGPSDMLEMHEWLHQVVAFEPDTVVWPPDDVHGGCKIEPYASVTSGCMVNPQYFADLMSGKVKVNGKLTGITPQQWVYNGTPTAPRHIDPALYIETDPESYTVEASVESGSARQIRITIDDKTGKQLAARTLAPHKRWAWPGLKDGGTFIVCAAVPEDGAYAAAHLCQKATFEASTAGLVWLSKPRYRGSVVVWVLHAKGVLIGRHAKITINAGSASGMTQPYHLKTTIKLRPSKTFTVPGVKAHVGWGAYFDLFLPAFTAGGKRYSFTGLDGNTSR